MPTIRDIITQGLTAAQITRAPTSQEAADGLFVMQGMYEGLVADGAFGVFENIRATADVEADPGQRIYVDGAFTVTLPDTIEIDGLDVRPVDLACIEVIETDPATSRTAYVYEAARGEWVQLTGLTLDSEAPLATRGRDGLALMFAMTFAEQFGQGVLTPLQLQKARQFKGSILWKAATRGREVEYF